jgi:uncharacterized protein
MAGNRMKRRTAKCPYLCTPMLIYLKVKPNQRFDRIEKIANEAGNQGPYWQVRLKAPAVDGKANDRLVEYLSSILGLPKSKITLVKGQTARIKCVEIMAGEQDVLSRIEKESGDKPDK